MLVRELEERKESEENLYRTSIKVEEQNTENNNKNI